jgi:hypothetical protein
MRNTKHTYWRSSCEFIATARGAFYAQCFTACIGSFPIATYQGCCNIASLIDGRGWGFPARYNCGYLLKHRYITR